MSICKRFKTLPPFVKNAKYSAYLTIEIKSIRLKGIIERSCDDFGVRVIWWGETESSRFRNSITYLIAPNAFKTYLKYCHLLELTITRNNDDIGSAFIYNPIEISKKSLFNLPVVDHGGDIIGQIVFHVIYHYPSIEKKYAIDKSSIRRFISILENLTEVQ